MKKIKIMQNAATFTSDLTVQEIKLLQAQCPDALSIVEPTPDGIITDMFRVCYKNTAFGEIATKYITFVDATPEGNACLTVLIPANVPDRATYMFNNYGHAVNMLKIVERKAKAALNNLVTSKEAFSNDFTDLDQAETLEEALEDAEIIIKASPTVKGGKK